MEISGITSKAYFSALNIVYLALLAGQIFFMLVTLFINSNDFVVYPEELNTYLRILVPLFTISGIAGSFLIAGMRLGKIRVKSDIREKLTDYRSLMIPRLALLEAPSFFAITCYLLTANLLYLIFSGLVIAVFLTFRPSRNKVARELELNQDEIDMIENPDAIVAGAID